MSFSHLLCDISLPWQSDGIVSGRLAQKCEIDPRVVALSNDADLHTRLHSDLPLVRATKKCVCNLAPWMLSGREAKANKRPAQKSQPTNKASKSMQLALCCATYNHEALQRDVFENRGERVFHSFEEGGCCLDYIIKEKPCAVRASINESCSRERLWVREY